jgi:hypothetical protein
MELEKVASFAGPEKFDLSPEARPQADFQSREVGRPVDVP